MSKQATRSTAPRAKTAKQKNASNTVTPFDTQWGLRRAKETGLRIVEPRPNELQLDIDSIGLLTFHEMQWSILKKAGITKGWRRKIRKSKRGGSHVHVTITLPMKLIMWMNDSMYALNGYENFARVCLQTILGSDPKREAFNLCRVINGNKYPIVFFEKEK
jgi:hypothetical protein